jgi:hypothetical protein
MLDRTSWHPEMPPMGVASALAEGMGIDSVDVYRFWLYTHAPICWQREAFWAQAVLRECLPDEPIFEGYDEDAEVRRL